MERTPTELPGMSGGSRVTDATCTADLHLRHVQLIAERQVIPRLRYVLAGRDASPTAEARAGACASAVDDEVAALLAARLATGDRVGCVELVESLMRRCTRDGHALLETLSASADWLNRLIEADSISAADASIASCTLQFLLHHFAVPTELLPDESRRVLLVAPDRGIAALDVFKLRLCSEYFRRDGWDVRLERDMTSESFRRVIASEWFDVIEVFATMRSDLDATAIGIQLVRSICANPAVGIVVCGDPFRQRPGLVRDVKADRLATDPSAGVSQARDLHATAAQRLERRLRPFDRPW